MRINAGGFLAKRESAVHEICAHAPAMRCICDVAHSMLFNDTYPYGQGLI